MDVGDRARAALCRQVAGGLPARHRAVRLPRPRDAGAVDGPVRRQVVQQSLRDAVSLHAEGPGMGRGRSLLAIAMIMRRRGDLLLAAFSPVAALRLKRPRLLSECDT